MTQEEKQLLLIDLSARLPYKVKGIYARTDIKNLSICEITTHLYGEMEESFNGKEKYEFIPYLRPMSSMTQEERRYLLEELGFDEDLENGELNDFGSYVYRSVNVLPLFDWLNAHHFDYRGLIEKDLALEAPEDMYKKY